MFSFCSSLYYEFEFLTPFRTSVTIGQRNWRPLGSITELPLHPVEIVLNSGPIFEKDRKNLWKFDTCTKFSWTSGLSDITYYCRCVVSPHVRLYFGNSRASEKFHTHPWVNNRRQTEIPLIDLRFQNQIRSVAVLPQAGLAPRRLNSGWFIGSLCQLK